MFGLGNLLCTTERRKRKWWPAQLGLGTAQTLSQGQRRSLRANRMLVPRRAVPKARGLLRPLSLPLLFGLLLWPLVGGRDGSLGLLGHLCTPGLRRFCLLCGDLKKEYCLEESSLTKGILSTEAHHGDTREGSFPSPGSQSTWHQAASGLLYLPVQWPVGLQPHALCIR